MSAHTALTVPAPKPTKAFASPTFTSLQVNSDMRRLGCPACSFRNIFHHVSGHVSQTHFLHLSSILQVFLNNLSRNIINHLVVGELEL